MPPLTISVQKIKEKYPQVRLIQNKENYGFAKACNIGLKQSDKPFILIMNPDVVIKAEDVWELVKFLEYHPDAAAVGPRLVTPDGNLLPSVYKLPTLTQELGHLFGLKGVVPRVIKCLLPKTFLARRFGQFDPHDKVRRCEMLVGSCVLFRKGALDDVGGFDEDFFLYYEEKDLFKRLGDKGYHAYFTLFAKAIHAVGKSAETVPALAFRSRYESMMKYHEKHSGKIVRAIVRLSISIFLKLKRW